MRIRLRLLAALGLVVAAFATPLATAHAAGTVVFSDQFNTGSLDLSKWSYLLGEYPTNAQIYLPTEVAVDGGGLHLLATQPYPFTLNLAGGIQSSQTFLYGEFHVVARLPQDNGLWPAAWLSAQKNGEIDIFEGFGSHTTRFQTTVHDWNTGSEPAPRCVQVGWVVKGSICDSWMPTDGHGHQIDWHAAYHDFGMKWTPYGTSFTLDGHQYWSTNWSPSVPMRLVLNDGMGTYWDGYPDGTDRWPASLDIKSVTVKSLP